MKKYKGVILDLDGTLLDTVDDLGESMNETLKILEYPTFTMDEYKLKIGGGFMGLATSCLPEGIGEETISRMREVFSEIYAGNYANKTKPYEGINELLDGLVSKGMILAINSNKRNHYTEILADKFFSQIPFVKIFGQREGVLAKPDPFTALETVEAMGLNVDEVLYIGDTEIDIQTANNAHMDSVGVSWGFRGPEVLRRYGATYIVEKPKDILELL